MKAWVLSASVLVMSPVALAAKKTPLEEIKELQASLVKSKSSIDNLLANRAHIIPNENYTQSASSVVRQVSLAAIRDGEKENVFFGPEAMTSLIKNSSTVYKEESAVRDTKEKIYSLAVVNPDHLKVFQKAQEELKKTLREEDRVSRILGNYIEYSMKAQRYITFKEADQLSNQIAKMNSDLQELEELSVKLSLKEQAVLTNFQKSMNEWMNKKLVFVTVARNGFSIDMKKDFYVYIPGVQIVRSAYLNKDYSPQNVSNILRKTLIDSIVERQADSHWDDFQITVKKNKADLGLFESAYDKFKFPVKEVNQIKVVVRSDLKAATISTNKFSFDVALAYQEHTSFIISQEGKQLYDHVYSYESNYYNNSYDVKALLALTGISEVSMKELYRNYGQDYFSNAKDAVLSIK
ncbi:hypothetical protein DOM21_08930 [Bacteriovorax stolpii]|uniref:long-chain fatty acid--CoA ligase n=1 Tax=Bacteriovorax stolpii TaxID=960 RepID=UPI00115885E1|nr:long-chain fatty acid--CoA ligase [Bacteriovorax stolpii]QDK41574.1 hypothetical protein DOM21_08930 [Bacteriovorax stolpii]